MRRAASIARRLALLLAVSAAAGAAAADNAGTDEVRADRAWTVTALFENDLFGDRDAQYTNGIQLSWISPDIDTYRDSRRVPRWALPWIDRLHLLDPGDGAGRQHNVAFSIGQKMFTPEDVSRRDLVRDDRPYAGWLYAGAAFHSKDFRVLDTMELQIGMVGPAALGEEAQDLVHELRGIPEANGWDHQLENEPGIALIYERKWRAYRTRLAGKLELDAITHVGAALGNVFTYANAGMELRLGWQLPTDFGTSLIRPGGESNAPTTARDARFAGVKGFSVHGFAALTGRAVARDIFLDGNTFADSHEVDKEPLVADLLVGVAFTWGPWKLSYAQVFRTREFETQDEGHEFGSLSLSYTF